MPDLTGICKAPGWASGAHHVGSTSIANVHRLETQTTETYLFPLPEARGQGSRHGRVGSLEASLLGM